jgi:hypothetical protein
LYTGQDRICALPLITDAHSIATHHAASANRNQSFRLRSGLLNPPNRTNWHAFIFIPPRKNPKNLTEA